MYDINTITYIYPEDSVTDKDRRNNINQGEVYNSNVDAYNDGNNRLINDKLDGDMQYEVIIIQEDNADVDVLQICDSDYFVTSSYEPDTTNNQIKYAKH